MQIVLWDLSRKSEGYVEIFLGLIANAKFHPINLKDVFKCVYRLIIPVFHDSDQSHNGYSDRL